MRTIPFYLFNIHERFIIFQTVEHMLESRLEALPEIAPILQSFRSIRTEMEQALHLSRSSSFSEQINEADESQDDGYLCFRTALESNLYSIIDRDSRDKARRIEEIIRRHGWSLQRFGNKKQLAVSQSLITELSEKDNQQFIFDLGIQPEYNAWKDAVENVKQIYLEKAEYAAIKPDITAAGELGKQGVELLEKVLPGWAYQSEFADNTAYSEWMNAIIESIDEMEVQARQRQGRKKASTEEKQSW